MQDKFNITVHKFNKNVSEYKFTKFVNYSDVLSSIVLQKCPSALSYLQCKLKYVPTDVLTGSQFVTGARPAGHAEALTTHGFP